MPGRGGPGRGEAGCVSEIRRLVHVADDPLDWDGADGAPEEQLLDGACAHSSQGRQ